MKIPRAPAGLLAKGKRFWKKVLQADYELTEAHDLERFYQACRCLDEIAESEVVVKTDGRFIKDRFQQPKENPAAKSIRDNKILFCRIIRELGFDLDIPESRPPRQY